MSIPGSYQREKLFMFDRWLNLIGSLSVNLSIDAPSCLLSPPWYPACFWLRCAGVGGLARSSCLPWANRQFSAVLEHLPCIHSWQIEVFVRSGGVSSLSAPCAKVQLLPPC